MTRWIDTAEQSVRLLDQKRDVAVRASRSGQRHHDPHCETKIAALHIGHSCYTAECSEEEFDIMEAANVLTITSRPCFPRKQGLK
jgi:hypothetical protein